MNDSLNNTDRDSSYTLPELLLTLALTALLILAGSYGWRQHQSARQLASSAHHLMDFIVRQQWHAAWGNRRCRITAVVGERWQLSGDPICGLGRASPGARREPARCAAPYTGVRLSLSTAGELSLGGCASPPARRTSSSAIGRGVCGWWFPAAVGSGYAASGGAGRGSRHANRVVGRRGGATSRCNASRCADAEAAPASAGEGCAGFSLPELLAALAAYSVLLMVALHLFPALHRGAEGAIR